MNERIEMFLSRAETVLSATPNPDTVPEIEVTAWFAGAEKLIAEGRQMGREITSRYQRWRIIKVLRYLRDAQYLISHTYDAYHLEIADGEPTLTLDEYRDWVSEVLDIEMAALAPDALDGTINELSHVLQCGRELGRFVRDMAERRHLLELNRSLGSKIDEIGGGLVAIRPEAYDDRLLVEEVRQVTGEKPRPMEGWPEEDVLHVLRLVTEELQQRAYVRKNTL